jgi:hypothetical protein
MASLLTSRRTARILLVLACCFGFGRAEAKVPVVPAKPAIPQVEGPIPVTAHSRPWAEANAAVEPIDLGKRGYVEEEYFIRGTARTLDWPAAGKLDEIARGPYATRILIRRPADPRKFSGTVVVEPLNPSIRYDLPLIWGSSHEHFLRHGDVWVGVTVKPVAIAALKEFDARRYAGLGFPNPLPPDRTCAQDKLPLPRGGLPPESSPATENGLMWDALSQVGALFKSDSRGNPLRDFHVERLYMAGDSQSGGFVLDYAEAIHPFVSGPAGGPLWDGYLATVATGPGLPINQCAAPIPQGDPRLELRPVGVPVIVVVSQSEIHSLRRRPDSDIAPDLFREYEVAGASHIHEGDDAGTPSPADIARTSGANLAVSTACKQDGAPGNDVPFGMIVNRAFGNLEAWSRDGIPPPRGDPMVVTDPGTAQARLSVDEFGNALGGVRSPQVDVPTATYHERMDGPGICELWGWREPFSRETLARLYPSNAVYVDKVRADVARLVEQRWLEPEDGATLVRRASSAPVP